MAASRLIQTFAVRTSVWPAELTESPPGPVIVTSGAPPWPTTLTISFGSPPRTENASDAARPCDARPAAEAETATSYGVRSQLPIIGLMPPRPAPHV